MPTYYEICQMPFWKEVFDKEYSYLTNALAGCKTVLSVGCGPAMIERMLSERGFEVTGMDVSEEALADASDSIRKVVGSAEMMKFPDNSFDAAIYVASLQFIDDYRKAIKETARVLGPNGKLVAMLLNTDSLYFEEQTRYPESYMRKIKHKSLSEIEKAIAEQFEISSEYYMGIVGEGIFESSDPRLASLYVVSGTKR